MNSVRQSNNARPGHTAGGFTLIELLVTISIIALLMGILLPVIPRARDLGRMAGCGARLRSVGQAITLYINNNKDAFPIANYMPPPWLSNPLVTEPPLYEALEPYFEGQEGYRCPGDKVVYYTDYDDPAAPGTRKICGMSYTYITALNGKKFEDSFFMKRLKLTPSDCPIVYDCDGYPMETQDGRVILVNWFHSKRNTVFADGHVGPIEGPPARPPEQPPQPPGGG